jgi:integrase
MVRRKNYIQTPMTITETIPHMTTETTRQQNSETYWFDEANDITLRREKSSGPWVVRIRDGKSRNAQKIRLGCEYPPVASIRDAIKAREHARCGILDKAKEKHILRREIGHLTGPTVKLYEEQYDDGGIVRPNAESRHANVLNLQWFVRMVDPKANFETLPLNWYTGARMYDWKKAVRDAAIEEADGDDERYTQLLRSANSRLRAARSVFSSKGEMREFYHHNKIELPDSIAGFITVRPFAKVEKSDYHPASDALLTQTFAAIEALVTAPENLGPDGKPLPEKLNEYLSCWLAIGFAFRASEIGCTKVGWFQSIGGSVWAVLDKRTKNKSFPRIKCQLGAWAKIAPWLANRKADEYVLTGSPTERTETVFRRITALFKQLGWQTTHHLHELRAWSGCQVAIAFGLREAQVHMRHANYQTTERHYGHYLTKAVQQEVAMPAMFASAAGMAPVPPAAPAAPFTPVVLPAVAVAA